MRKIPTIHGRSSSHFTRVTRVFAHELGIEYRFQPVFDLLSLNAADYADNPALKLPVLQTEAGAWFGALNICRELARRAQGEPRILWPEDMPGRLCANLQELIVQAMSTEVTLIMGTFAGSDPSDAYRAKSRESLTNCVAWLERCLPEVLENLPADRPLSFLEVSLFCLFTHLGFRGVLDTAPYPNLNVFSQRFGQRPSALDTPYGFDRA